jgi:hypothetical protein
VYLFILLEYDVDVQRWRPIRRVVRRSLAGAAQDRSQRRIRRRLQSGLAGDAITACFEPPAAEEGSRETVEELVLDQQHGLRAFGQRPGEGDFPAAILPQKQISLAAGAVTRRTSWLPRDPPDRATPR